MENRIILASASPRRAEILKNMGFDFIVIPSDIDEDIIESQPKEFIMTLAKNKALHVSNNNQGIIISADTIVVSQEQILGKPKDEADAKKMLKMLSGDKHSVYTGVCVFDTSNNKILCDYDKTDVYFDNMSDKEIEEYIKTGEPMDKAGAYGIQGKACKYINRIEGCYFNVMGLPASKLYKMLKSIEYIL